MPKVFSLHTKKKNILGDILSPVQVYLKLRDSFPNAFLLESSDYNSARNSFSFICFESYAYIKIDNHQGECKFPDGRETYFSIPKNASAIPYLNRFFSNFKSDSKDFGVGFFGTTSYESVKYFESISLDSYSKDDYSVPEIFLHLFRFVVVFNHFHNSITIMEHLFERGESKLENIYNLIVNKPWQVFPFNPIGETCSNLSDSEFINILEKGKSSCYRGDVFQLVLSRQFSQAFIGDEFNVYRALRSVNPSPYLFYFDFGNYKIFGSSPESQLIIENGVASINPIAGTFKRTGKDEQDKILAEELLKDKKENAEHMMLVDLARNELSKNSNSVKIVELKNVQYFSHVLHMVSKVQAKLTNNLNSWKVYGDTFPAGTLTGAPKYRAMELIDKYENQGRGIYGGALGYFGLDGSIKSAIVIRTFISKRNTLYFQAGAGVVSESILEKELEEVNNKMKALFKAIELAKTIV